MWRRTVVLIGVSRRVLTGFFPLPLCKVFFQLRLSLTETRMQTEPRDTWGVGQGP